MNYKIVILSGDGIGAEVTNEAVKVLKAISEIYKFEVELGYRLIGGAACDAVGTPLPWDTISACKVSDAVLLGAVGGTKWDSLSGDMRPEAGLLGIRKELGLFTNLRPVSIFRQLKETSPLKNSVIESGVDFIIVRELTGGIYFGKKGRDGDTAYDTEQYSVAEIERILKAAFAIAKDRRKNLCVVDKANVLESSRLWREVAEKMRSRYSEVQLSYMYVDNCAMQMVKNPAQFDVIVTSNLFGDILSDEAAMISGSIGMLASASLGASTLGIYEGIHGSAPDIAGKNIANPLATILSVAMMLKYSLNQLEASKAVYQAVDKALDIARTADISTSALNTIGTEAMGDLIVSLLKEQCK